MAKTKNFREYLESRLSKEEIEKMEKKIEKEGNRLCKSCSVDIWYIAHDLPMQMSRPSCWREPACVRIVLVKIKERINNEVD